MKNNNHRINRIGLLTAGGDCPGLNAVIRVITKTALYSHAIEVIGFKDGYDGLIKNDFMKLTNRDASGILTLGGTILGTSNIANPYNYAVTENGKTIMKNVSKQAIANYRHNCLDALIVVGGDGTLSIASKLIKDGLNIVAVPKTIDNDLSQTDFTFGFDSALTTATSAIDKLHSTAQSHHRVMLVEVMGRYAGWIALYSGVAGGGDVILLPEFPYDIKKICKKIEDRHKHGKRFSIIVVAEGAKPKGGKLTISRIVKSSTDKIRLGGVANVLATEIEDHTGAETRATVIGHVQRGGSPTAFDRNLATAYGAQALKLVLKKDFGKMAAWKDGKMTSVKIADAISKLKLVHKEHPLFVAAKEMGISFGN